MKTVMKIAAALTLAALCAPTANAQNDAAPSSGPPVWRRIWLNARFAPSCKSHRRPSPRAIGLTSATRRMAPAVAASGVDQRTARYDFLCGAGRGFGVNRPEPIVHWIIYNISPAARGLCRRFQPLRRSIGGAAQGKNIAGKVGYIGPKPPAGQTHPYHFRSLA